MSSILSLLGISVAYAADTGGAQPKGGLLDMLPMLIIIGLAAYFLFIRPQQKRAKAQRELMNKISIGDEVVTIGGIVGKVAKLRDNFVVLVISNGVELTMRKAAIDSVLPKGTLESE